ncbi:MAG: SulP family inorganic anion transporter [Deltaproteobacteria bacterium]|nr:SulP family inorganic anion transporter [Deltaproteobacteria bacterium]
MNGSSFFSHSRGDVVAGAVVFLVALPLCLGIAIACGVPPVAGLIAGVVGGLVVPLISRSPMSVTGPAAGLTSIVLLEVAQLGGLAPFAAAVVIAGGLQFTLGLLRAGRFSALVPSAAIKGMLAAIGITIVLKQVPVAFGVTGALKDIAASWSLGSTLLALVSLAILLVWPKTPLRRVKFVPAALVVVVLCTVAAALFEGTRFAIDSAQFVVVPLGGPAGLWGALIHPEPAAFLRSDVWIAGFTIAVVASIETLLSVQAIDRLDPLKRRSPPDRELVAQGVANSISGLLGGLPVTAVIVRSGANLTAGGRERFSAFVHGILLLVAVLVAAPWLNHIPLACLAAVLIVVGMNLAKPSLFLQQARLGFDQLLPFLATIAAVLALDLLKGVVAGIVISLLFALRQNNAGAIHRSVDNDGTVRLRFRRDATFLTKPQLLKELDDLADRSNVVIETRGEYVDLDGKEVLAQFLSDASSRQITARVEGVELHAVAAGGH